MDYITPFKELKKVNSIRDKKEILRKNENNIAFINLLEANLNPYRQFYLRKLPKKYKISKKLSLEASYIQFLKLLDKLETRKVTGNEAREEALVLFDNLPRDAWNLFGDILFKKPIGVGAKTVNSVYGDDFVPEFNIMKAPSKIPDVVNLKYPCFVQPKLDGYRCIYKEGLFFTSKGNTFSNINLPEYFKNLQNIGDWVLDGELYIHGESLRSHTALLNADNKPVQGQLKYIVYDALPLEEWNSQASMEAYEDRLKNLRELLNDRVSDYKRIIDIPTDKVDQASELIELYKEYLDKGYEGVMIKDVDAPYRWKRVTVNSGEMLKLKPANDVDLEVVDIYEGEGKYKGKLGGIICEYKGNKIKIGTGLSDKDRELVYNNPDKYVGKIAEIKYFDEEGNTLRDPRFHRWRPDK